MGEIKLRRFVAGYAGWPSTCKSTFTPIIQARCAVVKILKKQWWWRICLRTWWTWSSVTWSHCEARRSYHTTRWNSCSAASTEYFSFTDCFCRVWRTLLSERWWRSDQPTTSLGYARNLRFCSNCKDAFTLDALRCDSTRHSNAMHPV